MHTSLKTQVCCIESRADLQRLTRGHYCNVIFEGESWLFWSYLALDYGISSVIVVRL